MEWLGGRAREPRRASTREYMRVHMRHTAETPASTALSPCRVWCPRAAGPQPAQSETHTCANRVMGTHRVFTLTANRHDARRPTPRRAAPCARPPAQKPKAEIRAPRAARDWWYEASLLRRSPVLAQRTAAQRHRGIHSHCSAWACCLRAFGEGSGIGLTLPAILRLRISAGDRPAGERSAMDDDCRVERREAAPRPPPPL